MLTLIGTLPMYFAFLIHAFVDPTLSETPPQWMVMMYFLFIFLWQTADNLDGKQA